MPFGLELLEGLPVGARLPAAALGASLLVWALLQFVATTATRRRPVRAAAASQEFGGDEPPAVVNLLTSDWVVTEDAAEATLIDLAARGHLEFRQPGTDPLATTAHVLSSREPLTRYEEQLLDRVRGAATDGVVPLAALTFRDESRAKAWWRRFESAVVADARRRGLVRRRVPPWAVVLLGLVALVPAGATSWLAWELGHRSADGALYAGVPTFVLLVAVAGRRRGLRGTRRGREAAARWLGLRTYLTADRTFGALPPAAVAVWDRYLAYGDALGAAPAISGVVDLGMGNRKRLWSSFGGRWRRVRVRYPGPRSRYGATAPPLLVGALVSVGLGVGMGWAYLWWQPTVAERFPDRASWFVAVAVAGLLLALRGLYRSTRTVVDLLAPRTVVGEVLWVAPWRFRQRKRVDEVVVHYLAVDDGTADRTTAWALPSDVIRGFGAGDVVELRVRPWSRRVVRLSVAQSRHGHPGDAAQATGAVVLVPLAPVPDPSSQAPPSTDVVAAVRLAQQGLAAASRGDRPPIAVHDLGEQLGLSLTAPRPAPGGEPGAWMYPLATMPGAAVLVSLGSGRADQLVLGLHRSGDPVSALGDEAYTSGHAAVARIGEVVARVAVPVEAEVPTEALVVVLTELLTDVRAGQDAARRPDPAGDRAGERAHDVRARPPG